MMGRTRNKPDSPSPAAGRVPPAWSSRRATFLAAALVALATVAAYSNSFRGKLMFDDLPAIQYNTTIQQLWPIWKPLCPPNDGETVTGRPLLNLTLAVNYAISGLNEWSYHAVNLLIHVLAALLLFGIVRRTFLLLEGTGPSGPRSQGDMSMFSADVLPVGGVFPPKNGPVPLAGIAVPLAFIIALFWAVHPLQTESVTYIVQRAESLVGLFYLLTLYCVIRGATRAGNMAASSGSTQLNGRVPRVACPPVSSALLDKPGTDRRLVVAPTAEDEAASVALRPHPSPLPAGEGTRGFTVGEGTAWYVAAALACLAGMASKEVMVSAPLIVLLYDRAFLAGSFREALRRRYGLYVALAATWILLGWLVFQSGDRGGSAGVSERVTISSWAYFRTQFGAIVHYLRLSAWPHPLVLDYGTDTAHGAMQIVPYAILVGLLVAATLFALWRWPKVGFLGAWFFAILAPTSTIVPVATQTIAEHRMYLPLATVIVGAVLAAYFAGRRLVARGVLSLESARVVSGSLVVLVAIVFATLTVQRNAAFHDLLTFWEDAARNAPDNPRPHNNYGNLLADRGNTDAAIVEYRTALKINPNFSDAHYNLALALVGLGQTEQGIAHYEEALRIRSDFAAARNSLGVALVQCGRAEEAITQYEIVLEKEPDLPAVNYNYANALVALARYGEAIKYYEKAVKLKPDLADAWCDFALMLAACPDGSVRNGARAIELAQQANTLTNGQDPSILDTLAAAHAEAGQFAEALRIARRAYQLAVQQGKLELAKSIQDKISLYEKGIPYREPPPAPQSPRRKP